MSTDNRTIEYAIDELARYLQLITNQETHFRVGLMSSFPDVKAPAVDDPTLDDAIYVETKGAKGTIAGINARSVLLAVYRYLTEIGCRWVRPGPLGEHIPKLDRLPDVSVAETPSYRHRGIVIEGAVSFENVRDMIEFIPKLGFNSYFIQFREAYIMFMRWYSHRGNPTIAGSDISIEQAQEYTARLWDEIKKRGLIYHAVGHGWTCEPLGMRGLGWEPHKGELPEGVSQYFAMLNGERKLFGNVVLNTNLCYSNPTVQKMMVEEFANYAQAHPEIDMLCFALADGSNNMCECEACAGTRPSDYYVRMLNNMDELLIARGLDTRIVFILYVDLLWPAITERINNPDRFILMFCPIERTYSHSFSFSGELPGLPEFVRNKLPMPKGVEENVAFLRAWQEQFPGDCFDFDYHLMWDHYSDPGYMQISRILMEDIKGLKEIGLDGYMSCQTQKAFLPTGLPVNVMGRTLWDSSLQFDDVSQDYFTSAFGPDGELCRRYLNTLSELFDPVYLRAEKPVIDSNAAAAFGKIPGVIAGFSPVIERNLGSGDPCWAESWNLLRHHAQIYSAFAGVLQPRALGDDDTAKERWNAVKQMVREKEPALQQVMDVRLFLLTVGEYKFAYDPKGENY